MTKLTKIALLIGAASVALLSSCTSCPFAGEKPACKASCCGSCSQ